MDTKETAALLDEATDLYRKIRATLDSLIASSRERDAARIATCTADLQTSADQAQKVDERIIALARTEAAARGIPAESFKLSMMDPSGGLTRRVDTLREHVAEVARRASLAGGVLSANIGVIDETIRVLESLDQRAVGYGAVVDKPAVRLSKMIDRSA